MLFNELSGNEYLAFRENIIIAVEENGLIKKELYLDSKGLVTIGIGFNLSDPNSDFIRNEVYKKIFGQNIPNDLIIDINKIIVIEKHIVKGKSLSQLAECARIIEARINRILIEKNFTVLEFRFTQNQDVKDVLNSLVPEFKGKVDSWSRENNFTLPMSKERASIFSLAYNTIDGQRSLLGPKLATAIKDGNRAEAWYEIRYNSNLGDIPGVAKRRYYEADIFGLYYDEKIVSLEEARAVMAMYYRHRSDIEKDEKKNGIQVIKANQDYNTSIVKTLEESLGPAKNILEKEFAQSNKMDEIIVDGPGRILESRTSGAALTTSNGSFEVKDLIIAGDRNDKVQGFGGDDFLYGETGNDLISGGTGKDNIYGGQGSDKLFGNSNDDSLFGGLGNDTLNPGSGNLNGNDILKGGDGYDTYILDKTWNSTVIIEDPDAEGKVNRKAFSDSELAFHQDGRDLIIYRLDEDEKQTGATARFIEYFDEDDEPGDPGDKDYDFGIDGQPFDEFAALDSIPEQPEGYDPGTGEYWKKGEVQTFTTNFDQLGYNPDNTQASSAWQHFEEVRFPVNQFNDFGGAYTLQNIIFELSSNFTLKGEWKEDDNYSNSTGNGYNIVTAYEQLSFNSFVSTFGQYPEVVTLTDNFSNSFEDTTPERIDQTAEFNNSINNLNDQVNTSSYFIGNGTTNLKIFTQSGFNAYETTENFEANGDPSGSATFDFLEDQLTSNWTNVFTMTYYYTGNRPPVAVDDQGQSLSNLTEASASIEINILTNDSDPDGVIDPSTVALTNTPTKGTVAIDPITGQAVYSPNNEGVIFDRFSYTVADNEGAISNEANLILAMSETVDIGTDENDNLVGSTASNALVGQGGDDTLDGGEGDDILEGGEGADSFLFGQSAGNDTVTDFSREDGDKMDVSANGTLFLAPGMLAQDGEDALVTLQNNGTIRIQSIDVTDLIPSDFEALTGAMEGDINGDGLTNDIDLNLLKSQFFQEVHPGTGADLNVDGVVDVEDYTILSTSYRTSYQNATEGDDNLIRSRYDDTILGLEGNDQIWAGAGNDLIEGGPGIDALSGGRGADQFVFKNILHSPGSNPDTINDFIQGEDIINLSGLGYSGISQGTASGSILGYTHNNGNTIIQSQDGQFSIILNGLISLSELDFIFSDSQGSVIPIEENRNDIIPRYYGGIFDTGLIILSLGYVVYRKTISKMSLMGMLEGKGKLS